MGKEVAGGRTGCRKLTSKVVSKETLNYRHPGAGNDDYSSNQRISDIPKENGS
jgi:hypothetical protein